VCAINGETYWSECEAWSVGDVLVDYLGLCRVFAFHDGQLSSACFFTIGLQLTALVVVVVSDVAFPEKYYSENFREIFRKIFPRRKNILS